MGDQKKLLKQVWIKATAKLMGSEQHVINSTVRGLSVEELAAKFHAVYQAEARRQNDVRHSNDYAELPEKVKEFDRALARYVLELLAVSVGGDEYHKEVTLAIEPEDVLLDEDLKALVGTLNDGKDLVESSVSHVSHGGPTMEQAEVWLELARAALKRLEGKL